MTHDSTELRSIAHSTIQFHEVNEIRHLIPCYIPGFLKFEQTSVDIQFEYIELHLPQTCPLPSTWQTHCLRARWRHRTFTTTCLIRPMWCAYPAYQPTPTEVNQLASLRSRGHSGHSPGLVICCTNPSFLFFMPSFKHSTLETNIELCGGIAGCDSQT